MNKRLFIIATIFCAALYFSCTEIPDDLRNGDSMSNFNYCYNPFYQECASIPSCITENDCNMLEGTSIVTYDFCADNNQGIYSCLSSSSNNSYPSSSSQTPAFNLWCDFGPVTSYGGGCFRIDDPSECDTQWGKIVSACSTQETKYCYNSDGLGDCDGIPCGISESACNSRSGTSVVSESWCISNNKEIYDCY